MSPRDRSPSSPTIESEALAAFVEPSVAIAVSSSTVVTTTDVTERLAKMNEEVARHTFSTPAQEETKRSQQETFRTSIVAVCSAGAIVAMVKVPEVAWPLAMLMSVFGGATVAPSIIDKWRKKVGA